MAANLLAFRSSMERGGQSATCDVRIGRGVARVELSSEASELS
jgi:hypothetical protein